MNYKFKTSGVCSRSVSFDLEDDTVKNVFYEGGCNGNLQAIAKLVEGKNAKDVIDALAGIRCGYKTTSCPDQLSKALELALEKGEEE